MEIAGFVLAAITALVGLGVKLRFRIDDGVKGLKGGMRVELRLLYRKLARQLSQDTIVEEDRDDLAREIAQLHCRCHDDVALITAAQSTASWVVPVVILATAIGLCSAAFGVTVYRTSSQLVQASASIGVPFAAFAGELAFVGLLMYRDRRVRQAIDRYQQAEI